MSIEKVGNVTLVPDVVEIVQCPKKDLMTHWQQSAPESQDGAASTSAKMRHQTASDL